MAIQVHLTAFTSNIGDEVILPRSGVTCIVGGNNVGKSQVLRDAMAMLEDPEARPVALSSLKVDKSDINEDSVESFLKENGVLQSGPENMTPSYIPLHGGRQITPEHFLTLYSAHPNILWATASFFVNHTSAGSLLNLATSSLGTPGMSPGSGFISRLFRDGSLERSLSDLCFQVFSFYLTLDRINGDVRLRVGQSAEPVPPLNNPTIEYANSVAALPLLENQARLRREAAGRGRGPPRSGPGGPRAPPFAPGRAIEV